MGSTLEGARLLVFLVLASPLSIGGCVGPAAPLTTPTKAYLTQWRQDCDEFYALSDTLHRPIVARIRRARSRAERRRLILEADHLTAAAMTKVYRTHRSRSPSPETRELQRRTLALMRAYLDDESAFFALVAKDAPDSARDAALEADLSRETRLVQALESEASRFQAFLPARGSRRGPSGPFFGATPP